MTEAAKGLTQNDQNDDGTGADLAPLLADLLDRTARAAGNFAAHQSRLWPKSRTLAQVCAARRDAEAVDDAVAACLKVLEEAHARANETSAEAGERMRFRENQNAQTRDAFPEKADDSAAPAAAARWALAHACPSAARGGAEPCGRRHAHRGHRRVRPQGVRGGVRDRAHRELELAEGFGERGSAAARIPLDDFGVLIGLIVFGGRRTATLERLDRSSRVGRDTRHRA